MSSPRCCVLLVLLALPVAGCARPTPAPEKAAVTTGADGLPAGLPRYRRWSGKIAQGGEPEGEIAFRNLAALGFTTVISVDGAPTDVEAAERNGLRYVHVPIGYDGIERDEALRIVKAVRMSDGPVYVHCHHGKHRGPAGAMLARVAEDGISTEDALEGLRISETSPGYEGLWRDVARFEPPGEAELSTVPDALPACVLPAGFRATMVQVNLRYEHLRASRLEDWAVPAGHPDVSPPHEARILLELYREAARLDDVKARGEDFLALLGEAEGAAGDLEQALRAKDLQATEVAYKRLQENCKACHAEYRD